jgi:hypothetical protein
MWGKAGGLQPCGGHAARVPNPGLAICPDGSDDRARRHRGFASHPTCDPADASFFRLKNNRLSAALSPFGNTATSSSPISPRTGDEENADRTAFFDAKGVTKMIHL